MTRSDWGWRANEERQSYPCLEGESGERSLNASTPPHQQAAGSKYLRDSDFVSPAFRSLGVRVGTCAEHGRRDGERVQKQSLCVFCAAHHAPELRHKRRRHRRRSLSLRFPATPNSYLLSLQVIFKPAVHVKSRHVRTDLSITLISLGEPVNPQRSENYCLIFLPVGQAFFVCLLKSSKH